MHQMVGVILLHVLLSPCTRTRTRTVPEADRVPTARLAVARRATSPRSTIDRQMGMAWRRHTRQTRSE